MKRFFLTLTMITFTVLLFSSCSGLRQVSGVQSTSFVPDYVRIEANINDYAQLGESTVTLEYREYLGFINKIDKVNGEDYNFRDVKIIELEGKTNIKLNGDIKKALYKVVEEYPNADYYVPVMKQTEVERMFLGKYIKESVILKAYKLK
ncbi:MAG: hypothetical protein E7066_07245 [Lentimicrobiaceae bacterium]|nr:hypothetical protein [Lentimicrobiaceae bacterium]